MTLRNSVATLASARGARQSLEHVPQERTGSAARQADGWDSRPRTSLSRRDPLTVIDRRLRFELHLR